MFKEFVHWLARSAVSEAFQATSWVIPVVQVIHILGIAVTLTTLLMFNFRLMGITKRGLSVAEMARGYLPWTWIALCVLLLSGSLLIVAEPGRELLSVPFVLKMLMVISLVVITRFVQLSIRSTPEYWIASARRRRTAGALGMVSVFLCAGIVSAGRLIAYMSHG